MSLIYQIALINYQFDSDYENARRFDSRAQQVAYFEELAGGSWTSLANFNVGNLSNTNQVIDFEDSASIADLLSRDYAVIRGTNGEYLYYFVTSSRQESGTRIALELELDVIQMYYIDIMFQQCIIQRAHLSRFIDRGGIYQFDSSLTSKLFSREEIQNVSKYLTKRTKLKLEYDNLDDGENVFNKWLDDNILCWVYYYLVPQGYHIVSTSYNDTVRETNINGKGIGLTVLCHPVYKSDLSYANKIKINSTSVTKGGDFAITEGGLKMFITMNEDLPNNIYQTKYSLIAPFERNLWNYSIDSNNNLVLTSGVGTMPSQHNITLAPIAFATPNIGFIIVDTQNGNSLDTSYESDKKMFFNKSEIVGVLKNKDLNPKLLGADFFSIALSTNDGQRFEYDLQKVGLNFMSIKYYEPLLYDITRGYMRYQGYDNSVYKEVSAFNFTGLVYTSDNTLPFTVTQISAFLAENKNFFQIAQMQKDYSFVKSSLGMASGALAVVGGAISANPVAIGGGVLAMGNAGANMYGAEMEYKNKMLTIDNMRSAPDMVKNASGNAIFTNAISKLGLYVEEYSALDNELEMANDTMYLYGFTYNRLDNIKNCDNLRKYFNYVRALVSDLGGISMSSIVKDKIKLIFARGIRFWNSDNINYFYENYERWLE